MVVMLLVAGGVALAANYYCGDAYPCYCPPGSVCVGTEGEDRIFGPDGASGEKIFAKGGPDGVYPQAGGDYVDAGPGDDYIAGDPAGGLYGSGNDTLYGGEGNDEIYGYGTDDYDECYGGPGDDYLDETCEKAGQ
jgi:Ca2+-binding RTX toxin-like protein